jgi:hypothetical protein
MSRLASIDSTLYVIGNDNDGGSGPNSLTAVNIAAGRPRVPLSLGPTPMTIAIYPDGGTVYIGDDDTITPVSTSTGKPVSLIETGPLFAGMPLNPMCMAIVPMAAPWTQAITARSPPSRSGASTAALPLRALGLPALPTRSSGTSNTAASATPGCPNRTASISRG